MGYANCTVTVNNGSVSSNPDPVPVSRASQNGVTWSFANAGYTFTGVLIDDVPAPTGDLALRCSLPMPPAGRS